MAIELSAVRLIAPWFGTSQAVWTSAIGAVLVALSVGYLLGGRLAAGEQARRRLSLCLWGSAAWAALLPVLAPFVAGLFAPESASLELVAAALPVSSLACALVLFFPPAILLATAGPIVVELLVRANGEPAGAAGGRVLAASTLGSLVGTFGTTYVGVPSFGITATLWLTSGLIAIGALLCSRASAQYFGALLLAGAGLASGGGAGLPAEDVLAVRESPYQRVRVVEQESGWRTLEVNERRGSFQSVWRPEAGLLGPGYYYDAFALPAHWSAPVIDWNTLVLGLGSGTAWRVLEGALPDGVSLSGTGVELDPVVIDLAREFMGLHDSASNQTVLSGWDARAVLGPLGKGDERWNQIIVDVYANQVEIPAHLATVEFYSSVADLLAPKGWLQVNVGASGVDDPLALAVASSMAFAFSSPTLALGVPFSRNVILLQRQGADLVLPGSVGFVPSYEPLVELASRMSLSGTWRLVGSEDGRLLHDGEAPLEDLQRASLAGMGAL